MIDDELDALAQRVGAALSARGDVLATAESCTGGWISAAITAVAGSSAWFDRGFVTYSNAAKQAMLGVNMQTLEQHGAVSEPTVLAMVDGALGRSEASIAVSVSGVAGPGGGSPAKPVGTVCIAWGTNDGIRLARTFRFPGDRATVRRQSVIVAMTGVIDMAGRTGTA